LINTEFELLKSCTDPETKLLILDGLNKMTYKAPLEFLEIVADNAHVLISNLIDSRFDLYSASLKIF
jgi:hypothetical protein